MQTVIIEINNPKAFALLKELEDLNILKIVKQNVIEKTTKLSEKYKGVFTKEDNKNFIEHVRSNKEEWKNI